MTKTLYVTELMDYCVPVTIDDTEATALDKFLKMGSAERDSFCTACLERHHELKVTND